MWQVPRVPTSGLSRRIKRCTIRYYLDTEFLERGPNYPLELISIGIVSQDKREYYAQSAEFLEHGKPTPWIEEHVLPSLGNEWKERRAIKDDILAFMDPLFYGKPEIWTYYGCYDHVIFCQLFGTMMDLPQGYPMYTMDLKQWCKMLGDPRLPEQGKGLHNALLDARWNRVAWEFLDKLALDYEMLR